MEAFSDMKTPDFVLDIDVIRKELRQQVVEYLDEMINDIEKQLLS